MDMYGCTIMASKMTFALCETSAVANRLISFIPTPESLYWSKSMKIGMVLGCIAVLVVALLVLEQRFKRDHVLEGGVRWRLSETDPNVSTLIMG